MWVAFFMPATQHLPVTLLDERPARAEATCGWLFLSRALAVRSSRGQAQDLTKIVTMTKFVTAKVTILVSWARCAGSHARF